MRLIFISTIILTIFLRVNAQENDSLATSFLQLEASYIGENYNNLTGGLKTGSVYQGMANLKLGLNTSKAGFWKGGYLFINGANTHGTMPSTLSGDYQVASNIEAGNHTYLQEFWYRQSFRNLEITAGLQDLNIQFLKSDNSGYFLNSSFGVIPTISGNIPSPIFPLTSLGLTFKWQASENTSWLAAAFDGCPTDFEENPYNLKWNLKNDDGIFAITELQRATNFNELPGNYKLGFFTHYHYKVLENENPETKFPENNYGFYFMSDQTLWQRSDETKKLAMFLQMGYTPEKLNCNPYYAGAGLNYSGLFNKNGEDVIGLGIAHAVMRENSVRETSVELTYQLPLSSKIFIQPDIQYIINPSGTDQKLNNSLSAIFRFGFSF